MGHAISVFYSELVHWEWIDVSLSYFFSSREYICRMPYFLELSSKHSLTPPPPIRFAHPTVRYSYRCQTLFTKPNQSG